MAEHAQGRKRITGHDLLISSTFEGVFRRNHRRSRQQARNHLPVRFTRFDSRRRWMYCTCSRRSRHPEYERLVRMSI